MKVTELLKLSDSEIKEYFKQNNGCLCLSHFYYRFWDNKSKFIWWKSRSEKDRKLLKRFPLIDFVDPGVNSHGVVFEITESGVKKMRIETDENSLRVIKIIRYDT